eukprot:5315026-Karenia_brevis.AAC.1
MAYPQVKRSDGVIKAVNDWKEGQPFPRPEGTGSQENADNGEELPEERGDDEEAQGSEENR